MSTATGLAKQFSCLALPEGSRIELYNSELGILYSFGWWLVAVRCVFATEKGRPAVAFNTGALARCMEPPSLFRVHFHAIEPAFNGLAACVKRLERGGPLFWNAVHSFTYSFRRLSGSNQFNRLDYYSANAVHCGATSENGLKPAILYIIA